MAYPQYHDHQYGSNTPQQSPIQNNEKQLPDPNSYPEVVPSTDQYPEHYQESPQVIHHKPEDQFTTAGSNNTTYPTNTAGYGSPFYSTTSTGPNSAAAATAAAAAAAAAAAQPNDPDGTADTKPPRGKSAAGGGVAGTSICGCSVLVFVLCAAIALLAATAIGLAAGTGVEARRANGAEDRVAALGASLAAASAEAASLTPTRTVTVTAPAPTKTPWADIDNRCSSDADTVSGQSYTSFKLLGAKTFTMHCNRDAPGQTLLSLFVADFNACMDACAAFTFYERPNFPVADAGGGVGGGGGGQTFHPNATCAAVSFIPLWTVKNDALDGKAPGNCYLKPGPQSEDTLNKPNIGTECHAAYVNKDQQ